MKKNNREVNQEEKGGGTKKRRVTKQMCDSFPRNIWGIKLEKKIPLKENKKDSLTTNKEKMGKEELMVGCQVVGKERSLRGKRKIKRKGALG